MPDASWIETLLWSALWQSSAWLLLGLGAATLCRHRPARAHAILLTALAAAALTPLLSGGFRLAGWGLLPGTNEFVGLADLPAHLSAADGVPVAGIGLTWVHAALVAWLTLSGVLIMRLIVSARRGRSLIAAATPVTDPRILALARRAADTLGLAEPPAIFRSDRVHCPVIWCWGSPPSLLAPSAALRTADDQLFSVLCHELAHLKRRDHLASLLTELSMCLLVWNPLAWLATRRAHDLSEQSCDTWVLAAGESPTTYAEALLGLVPQQRLALTPAAANGRRAVTRRIRRILDASPGEPSSGTRWVMAFGLATMLVTAGAALAHRRPPSIEVITPSGDSASLAAIGPDVITIPGELNLGVAEPGEAVTKEVLLCNRSTNSRDVFGAVTSCGCTSVSDFEPRTLGPGECMTVEVTMTAPTEHGTLKTKYVAFDIEGQGVLELPVHLTAGR